MIEPANFDPSHLVEAIETNAFDYHCTLCGATDASADVRLAAPCEKAALHPDKMDDFSFLTTLARTPAMTKATKARLLKVAERIAGADHMVPGTAEDIQALKRIAKALRNEDAFTLPQKDPDLLERLAKDIDMNRTYGMPWLARQVWDERLEDKEIVSILRFHPLIQDLHMVNGAIPQPTHGDDLKLVQRLLVTAQVASCTCCTKTPEIAFHDETCTYRLVVEASHLITLAQENDGGVRAPCLETKPPRSLTIWGPLTTALNDGIELPINTHGTHPAVVAADALIQKAIDQKLTIPVDSAEAVAFLLGLKDA
ncbi:hypothetical protein BAJUN_01260 [Bajunvirus bajun]|uniref:Uncharacterized protein n=1 Tax=Brevundimonas phage vB_BgoS-Bajun TaxID=2948594 RepID=A0A9E7N4I7_9CAUD|nr:hypothetical protein BAJUN_01260 [Brevundimonas phage vB_BgoS-Bajun]